jgi:amino acid adenylation domain-containing protein
VESLVDLLRLRSAEMPDAPALAIGNMLISYGRLDQLTDLAAGRLVGAGAQPGQFVGVLAQRNLESVVSLIAVLKSGAAYVPLDPEYPRDRTRFMVKDAGTELITGERRAAERLELLDHRFIEQPSLDEDARPEPTRRCELPSPTADSPAYVIYTSGSTGRPKGCVITHGNVLSLLEGALPLFDFSAQDRWAVFHSLCFDFSVWEVWGAIATGATAVMVPWKIVLSPDDLIRFVQRYRITVLNQVPSIFKYTVSAHAKSGRPVLALRYVVLGGESIDLTVVRAFVEGIGAGAPVMVNMYGITENTVHSTVKFLDEPALASGSASPIGLPLPHVGAYVLDEDSVPVPPGGIGELWLSGPSVSRGYLYREDLNAERFAHFRLGPNGALVRCYRTGDLVRRDLDGELHFEGRNDEQTKLRGFRIELREIETALSSHPLISDAVVIVTERRSEATLVAGLVCQEPVTPELAASVKAHVASAIPAYMVPRDYHRIDRIPLTPSGKRDRMAAVALLEGHLPIADLHQLPKSNMHWSALRQDAPCVA